MKKKILTMLMVVSAIALVGCGSAGSKTAKGLSYQKQLYNAYYDYYVEEWGCDADEAKELAEDMTSDYTEDEAKELLIDLGYINE